MIKILVLASLVCFAYSQIGDGVPDSRCPEETPVPPLHLNDPNDCQKFFVCSNGLAVPFECPPGQHWSVRDNWCDWPDRVRCEKESDEPGKGKCPPDNPTPPVHIPDEKDCNKFYKCSWGVPIKIHCPPGQHWSVANEWCDWPDRAKCKGNSFGEKN